jgi:hypothetical protein
LEKALEATRNDAVLHKASFESSASSLRAAKARVDALERALAEAAAEKKSVTKKAQTSSSSSADGVSDERRSLDDSALMLLAEVSPSSPGSGTEETEVSSLRRELDAAKRVAAMQEEEVCRAAAASAASDDAASVPRALLERWRAETFKLLLQQREAPVLLAQTKRDFAKRKAELREVIADEKQKTASSARKFAESEARREADERASLELIRELKTKLESAETETTKARAESRVIARHVAETVPKLEHEHARVQSMLEAKIERLDRSLKVSRERLHAFRKIVASSRTREETFKQRIASFESEADTALRQRDDALEAVRQTARNFDDERARLAGELAEVKRALERSEIKTRESRDECARVRREVIAVADAADAAASASAARAARDGALRERERHEAESRRLRLEAETARKEAERFAAAARRAELVAAKDRKESETVLVAERKVFDETITKRDSVIRELRVARDALLAERRELKANAAAADAGRRVERRARRETLETLQRVAGSAPSSPARAAKTTHAFGATSLGASSPRGYMSPKSMSPKSSPKKRLTNEPFVSSKQKPSGSLGSLLSRVGTVSGERAPGRKKRDPLTESVGGSYEQIVGARCAPVSLEDLEKSPSWQLQRRLESLEARAAALLLDEEEEAARR